MRIAGLLCTGLLLVAAAPMAQAQDAVPPVGTMSDLMTSMVYPAANELLLAAHRGTPATDKEWMTIQRSAVLLAESGNVLMSRGRVRDGDWSKSARMLVDAGAAAYKAARAKDATALAALDGQINASCTSCHKQYRPNVFPRP